MHQSALLAAQGPRLKWQTKFWSVQRRLVISIAELRLNNLWSKHPHPIFGRQKGFFTVVSLTLFNILGWISR